MKLDDILNAAREATGLPDPDSDSWKEGLEILLRDHARTDILNDEGWQMIKRRYVGALANRMRVDDHIRKHPEVLDVPVQRPVIIMGLVRTGTTMTSQLMAADPANRSVLRWEANNVAPPAEPGALRTDERCRAEKAQDEEIIKNFPEGVKSHFEPADGPTECVHLVAQDFRSMMYMALTPTPIYSDWMLSCDMSTAYEARKRALQVLQSTNPGRWVLKMPSDSVFIKQVFETFPDAKVIWNHRDPYAAFASSFSMRSNSQKRFNKKLDLEFMRCKWPVQLSQHVLRPLEVARQRPNDIYNLYYDDLVKDPVAAMKQIYQWLGDEWTPAAEAGMQQWLAENPQGRFGKHTYSLDEWGYTRKDLEPYFADYLKVHPVATGEEI